MYSNKFAQVDYSLYQERTITSQPFTPVHLDVSEYAPPNCCTIQLFIVLETFW